MVQIIINRPDGGQSVIANPPQSGKIDILVSPQEVEIQENEILVATGQLDNEGKDIYEKQIKKVKVVTREVEYRSETDEEWLNRVAEQALTNCKLTFGSGQYSYEIIN